MPLTIAVVCAASFATRLAAAKKQSASELADLVAKGLELSDIRTKGNPPYRLRAHLTIYGQTRSADGTLEKLTDGAGRWRRTIIFPEYKYQEIEVGNGEAVWRSASTRYDPYVVFRIKELLNIASDFPAPSETSWKKRTDHLLDGITALCAQSKGPTNAKREICLDPGLGLLLREEDWGPLRRVREFGDYTEWEGKRFPRTLRESEGGKVFVEVRLDELARETSIDPSLFTPPPNAEKWPYCAKPEPPTPLEKPEPHYPPSAEKAGEWGKALVWIIVGQDGRVYNATPLQSNDKAFVTSSIDTITNHWLFRPATCAGIPIPVNVLVETSFKLFQ